MKMKIKDYKCKCGHNDFFFADKGSQKGIYCSYCGKWLKWADKDEQNLAMRQEPRKGYWIWELDETPSTSISPYELNYAGWVCSCCHEFPDDICEWDNPDEPPTYKFCPNCGSYNGGASNGNE